VIAVAGLIFLGSAQSDARLSPDVTTDWVLRKIGHLAVYALLAFLTANALRAFGVPHAAALAILLGALYAVTDEFHQSLVPGRSSLAGDVMIDIAGLLIGLGAWRLLLRRRELRRAEDR
jgi:VanZ family protein